MGALRRALLDIVTQHVLSRFAWQEALTAACTSRLEYERIAANHGAQQCLEFFYQRLAVAQQELLQHVFPILLVSR